MRARCEQDEQTFAYRLYVTEGIKALASIGGTKITISWADLVEKKPVDNRSGDEIALDIVQRAGLKLE